jgi:hypothetical protein
MKVSARFVCGESYFGIRLKYFLCKTPKTIASRLKLINRLLPFICDRTILAYKSEKIFTAFCLMGMHLLIITQ